MIWLMLGRGEGQLLLVGSKKRHKYGTIANREAIVPFLSTTLFISISYGSSAILCQFIDVKPNIKA